MVRIFNHGILGMNARNLLYLKPFNPKKAVAFADNKIKTKAYLLARGIPVAKIYARIENREQLRAFDFSTLPDECVLKPNAGFGGEGILILKGRKGDRFLVQGKEAFSHDQLRDHIEQILEGAFSINGERDAAFFEKILVPHEGFAPFRPAGLPDVRIVVFNLIPVMAMLRVPTAKSGGKANVHQGGIGIGVDIAKGTTTHAVQKGRIIRELPHGRSPAGIPIPFWEEMLLAASRIQQITNIGYLAVDFTVDADQGLVLLEVNARAGLSVQIANLAPLQSRLERVKGLKVSSPEKAVRIAQDLFGEKDRPQSLRAEEDRPRLGLRETIVVHCPGLNIEVPAIVDPVLKERTTFAPDLLAELREKGGAERTEQGEEAYHVKFSLAGRKIQTLVVPGEVPAASVRAILGQRDLKGFLIDPALPGGKGGTTLVRPKRQVELRMVDKVLAEIDRQLLLLTYLKPLNLQEERARLEQDTSYSPMFHYPALADDIDALEERLEKLSPDDSPLGILLRKKRRELLMKIMLLRSRGDALRFTQASQALYGAPSSALLGFAYAELRHREACDLRPAEEDMLTPDKVMPIFQEALERYGLHDWHISIRPALVADCTVGWKHVYIREGALFARERAMALIAHEIETHILTFENGTLQPSLLFRFGFANYLDTQEGLAVYNQNRVLPPYNDKRYGPARTILAVAYSLEHGFVDLRHHLVEELGYPVDKALTKAIELKRGLHNTADPGGFTKGVVYFRGRRAIEHFMESGGDLKRLYVGKVALEDLDLVEKIAGVKPPGIIPQFLR